MVTKSVFNRYKKPFIKIIVFGIVGIMLYFIFIQGQTLEQGKVVESIDNGISLDNINIKDVVSVKHSLSILLIQIIIIIIFSRALAWIMSLIGQPTVIGEIIAGIMLGPSLLGLLFPEISSLLFPIASLSNLEFLSQIGLILFMFIIGMELDLGVIRAKAKEALFISNAGIIIPYIMGVTLAYFLYEKFAPQGTGFISFSLFIGIALSITAFPVLARIVQERGLSKQPIGMIVITSAAIDDISAWGILALVVAIANASAISGAFITIGLSIVYILIMIYVIRPLLNKIASRHTVSETISKTVVASVFVIMLISAFVTELIGIHALFGAFMAGVIMPTNVKFKNIMTEKMEDVSLVLLLPLFFVFTGLRTEIGLLNESSLWGYALLVIVVAITGKFIGTALASKFVGLPWKDSLIIGALMNTRGLIELVALNIGYDIGVLSPEIFTILVLMALITTFMTGPALTFINYVFKTRQIQPSVAGLLKVLISFGPPESGSRLLTLVSELFSGNQNKLKVTALHLTPNTEVTRERAKLFEEQAFSKIKDVASEKALDIETEYRTTAAVTQEITRTANHGKFDLLVVGSSRPLIGSDKTGGKARYFFENVKGDVALVIDNGFKDIKKILIICMDESSNSYLHSFTSHFNESIEVSTECLNDGEGLEVNDYTKFDLIISGIECFRLQRQVMAPWTIGSTSIMILSQYQEN